MQRRRTVAAAPFRTATAAWQTIDQLLTDTLMTSAGVDAEEVRCALDAAAPAIRILIAGGHLDRHPLVLVASPVHLSVMTVSGDAALREAGTPESVPGGASISEWTLYLPTPSPLEDIVRQAATTHARLSAEPPPDEVAKSSSTGGIDREAVARLLRENRP